MVIGFFKRSSNNRRNYKMTPTEAANLNRRTLARLLRGIQNGKYNFLFNNPNINKKFENAWGPNAAEAVRKRRNHLQNLNARMASHIATGKHNGEIRNGPNFGRVFGPKSAAAAHIRLGLMNNNFGPGKR
jgi:hypothetical protein